MLTLPLYREKLDIEFIYMLFLTSLIIRTVQH